MHRVGTLLLLLSLAIAGASPAILHAGDASETGFVELPPATDGSYVLVTPHGGGRAWGKPVTIRFIVLAAKEWQRLHPDGPPLRIGDISRPDGANFPPHKTHRDGLAIDLTTRGPNVCHVKHDDQDLTTELARLLVSLGARQILYNHPRVIAAVPEVTDWPKHDDHFHVVVQPDRVPQDGVPVVVPGPEVSADAWVGPGRLADDYTGLRLRWGILGVPPRWARSFAVEVQAANDGASEPLHLSDTISSAKNHYDLPLVLSHGRSYRWRVTVEGRDETRVQSAWATLRCDLTPPEVSVSTPADAATLPAAAPKLSWTFKDDGSGKQSGYRIELAKTEHHRRVAKLPDQVSGETSSLLSVSLRPGRTYWWRVVAWDLAGNQGASEWSSFELTR